MEIPKHPPPNSRDGLEGSGKRISRRTRFGKNDNVTRALGKVHDQKAATFFAGGGLEGSENPISRRTGSPGADKKENALWGEPPMSFNNANGLPFSANRFLCFSNPAGESACGMGEPPRGFRLVGNQPKSWRRVARPGGGPRRPVAADSEGATPMLPAKVQHFHLQ